MVYPVLNDTTLVLRCPYCRSEGKSGEMLAYNDGKFVCIRCAHTVRFDNDYECLCRNCKDPSHLLRLRGTPEKSAN